MDVLYLDPEDAARVFSLIKLRKSGKVRALTNVMEITTHYLRRLYRSLRWGMRDPDLGPAVAADRDLRYVSGYHHFM
jgi:hypothetical protein